MVAEALVALKERFPAIRAFQRSREGHAEVPQAEMFGYATAIRSLSKGRAAYSMEPFCFEPVPNSIVATILDNAKGKPAARA
jgi:translation elongation factor EF-G